MVPTNKCLAVMIVASVLLSAAFAQTTVEPLVSSEATISGTLLGLGGKLISAFQVSSTTPAPAGEVPSATEGTKVSSTTPAPAGEVPSATEGTKVSSTTPAPAGEVPSATEGTKVSSTTPAPVDMVSTPVST